VIFTPTGLCFFASLLFFTNLGIAIFGSLLGVVRLGGLKLFCYRRGLGYTFFPSSLFRRVLKSGDGKRGKKPALEKTMEAFRWWEKMSAEELQAFVTVWDEMLAEMRKGDLLSDAEQESLSFGPDGAKKAAEGQVPRIFDPTDVFRIANALPSCKEARRRIVAMARSVQMQPLPTGSVKRMPSMTVVIPHFAEDIVYHREALFQDGAPAELLRFLVKYYRYEFQNFTERAARAAATGEVPPPLPPPMRAISELTVMVDTSSRKSSPTEHNSGLIELPGDLEQRLCTWASLRMQTLWRTVEGICDGYSHALEALVRVQQPSLAKEAQRALVQEKFQVVLAMQRYAHFSDPAKIKDGHRHLEAVEALFAAFGAHLKIAFIDEEDGPEGRRYFSALIDRTCPVAAKPGRLPSRQPKYRIELPGYPVLGHGKSDNQNCAVIFARGEVLQMIDCNQEAYYESSLFLPLALQEFATVRDGRRPGILGFREHIFSDIGLLGRLAADSEFAFGTVIQRTMDWPLQARLHYGHPDMMDKLQVLQQGGVSKGTKGLNLSEDIFAGIDLTLRGGWTTYKEYFYVGKGRDMGFMSVLSFFSKVSMGNGEQAITRQWVRLGLSLSLPRFLGIFFTHIGYFLNQCLVNWAIKAFAFMAAIFSLLASIDIGADDPAVGTASSYFSVFYIMFTMTTALPLLFEVGIEKGVCAMLKSLISSSLALSPVFAAFQSKLMGHYFWSTLHYGGAQYIATGRGLATTRESFGRLFRTFAATHLHDSMELSLYLVLSYGVSFSFGFYFVVMFTIMSWSFAPFIFNPRQFDNCRQSCRDTREWMQWMCNAEGNQDESWVAWSIRLQEVRKNSTWFVEWFPSGRLLAVACTTCIVIVGSRFLPFMDSTHRGRALLVTPPVAHLLLCLLWSILKRTGICSCGPAVRGYPFLASMAIGLTCLELSTLEFWPNTWRIVLFHKYLFVRFLLEVADGVAARQPGGPRLAFLHETACIWALSFRWARDFVLGLSLAACCSLVAAVPACPTCHEYFLFRAHLNRGHYKAPAPKAEVDDLADTVGHGSASDSDSGSESSLGSDFEANHFEDPLFTFVRRFATPRRWSFHALRRKGAEHGPLLSVQHLSHE